MVSFFCSLSVKFWKCRRGTRIGPNFALIQFVLIQDETWNPPVAAQGSLPAISSGECWREQIRVRAKDRPENSNFRFGEP
jgi:hypothetical protein